MVLFVLNAHMTAPYRNCAIDFEQLGFSLHRNSSTRMRRPHRHNEIELTVLDRGEVEYLFGGVQVTIPAHWLCVRWAAIPHQCIDASADSSQFSLKIPLPWFLQWQLPGKLVDSLMHGELLLDREPDADCSDWAMFRRWHGLLQGNAAECDRIVLLEAEARLRRMTVRSTIHGCRRGSRNAEPGLLGKVDLMIHYIASRYTEDIDIAGISSSTSLHPRSAMRLFRETCGITLWECLTMHRVWHAQRLLAASEMKIRQVAAASGFNSPGRFYVAFKRIVGQLPRDYRASVRGPNYERRRK
jgi:AraC-like DNA-binding protein